VDISRFLVVLLENLSRLDFVEKVDIQTEDLNSGQLLEGILIENPFNVISDRGTNA
jgi:hypothetical protein